MKIHKIKQHIYKGFSLIELMIVVAIVGILSSIALPQYRDYVLRAEIAEATANLSGLRVKLEQYFQDNRTYNGACAAGTIAPIPSGLKYFSITCDLDNFTYTITATGNTNGFAFTVNEANQKSTTAVPTGWSTNNSCWIQNKAGSC